MVSHSPCSCQNNILNISGLWCLLSCLSLTTFFFLLRIPFRSHVKRMLHESFDYISSSNLNRVVLKSCSLGRVLSFTWLPGTGLRTWDEWSVSRRLKQWSPFVTPEMVDTQGRGSGMAVSGSQRLHVVLLGDRQTGTVEKWGLESHSLELSPHLILLLLAWPTWVIHFMSLIPRSLVCK